MSKSKKNKIISALKSLEKRYILSYQEADKWMEEINRASNTKHFDSYISQITYFGFIKPNWTKNDVQALIFNFTREDISLRSFLCLVDSIKSNPRNQIHRVAIKNKLKLCAFTKEKKSYTVWTLSELYPEFYECYPDILSEERLGKCHIGSIRFARYFENNDINVVTGEAYTLHPKGKTLHSWAETTIDGKEVVVDYTHNAIMDKKEYYDLFNVKPMQTLSNKDIINDWPLIKQITDINPNYIKFYLASKPTSLAFINNQISPEDEEDINK